MSNYVVWRPGYQEDGYFTLGEIFSKETGAVSYVDEGISSKEDWPSDIIVEMNESDPKTDKNAADSPYGCYVIVSSRVKTWLENEELNNNEFLPCAIQATKGRKIPEESFFYCKPY